MLRFFKQFAKLCLHDWQDEEIGNSGDSEIPQELSWVDYRRTCKRCGKSNVYRDEPWAKLW